MFLDEFFPLSPYRLSHGLCFKIAWKARQMNKAFISDLFKIPNFLCKLLKLLLLKPISPRPGIVSELSSAMLSSVLSHQQPLRACLSPCLLPKSDPRDHFHHFCVKFGSCLSLSIQLTYLFRQNPFTLQPLATFPALYLHRAVRLNLSSVSVKITMGSPIRI